MRLRATRLTGISSGGYRFGIRMKEIIRQAKLAGHALPPMSELKSLDRFCIDAVSALDDMDTFYILDGSGSVGFKLLNIANSGQWNGTANGGGIWSAEGFLGNGVNAYIGTSYNLLASGGKFSLNDALMGVVVSGVQTSGYTSICGDTSNANVMLATSANTQRINQGITALSTSIDFAGTGIKLLQRSSSTNVVGFSRAVKTAATAPSSALPNGEFCGLRRGFVFGSSRISSLLSGRSLSDDKVSLLRGSINKSRIDRGLAVIA